MKIHTSRQAIMASKLFRSSTRKADILAAIDDPINVELVEQLDEYIGDEYKDLLKPQPKEVEPEETAEAPEGNEDTGEDSGASKAAPAPGSRPTPLAEKYKDELEDLDGGAPELTEEDEETEDKKSAESSTKASGSKVVAETTLVNPNINLDPSLRNIAGEIKGYLNALNTTAGVVRVNVKGDELWVYYNDDINLNNVMSAAIESLSAANYQYLVFNRLARTDNAIVFTLSIEDTQNVKG